MDVGVLVPGKKYSETGVRKVYGKNPCVSQVHRSYSGYLLPGTSTMGAEVVDIGQV